MSAGALALGMSSCENKDVTFPDYDGGVSVYFPYQYPIRTIILGDIATYDNSRENDKHQFTIYSTMGGSYSGKDINVDVSVDESLLKGLKFADAEGNPGEDVKILPSDYYSLSGNTMQFKGNLRGGIDVTLSEKFFADEKCAQNTYVLPLVMTKASGEVKRILTGEASTDNAVRQDPYAWSTAPKDFTIYLVNFINKYDGNYLRRGTDEVSKFARTTVPSQIKVEGGAMQSAAWDNQFWILSDVPFENGKEWTLKMRVKADKEASVGTQTHTGPGGYIHWAAIGNVNFTTDWVDLNLSGKFDNDAQNGGNAIAFNLNDFADANNYYFDNIEFIVDGKVATKCGEAGGYAIKTNIGANPGATISSQYWQYDKNNADKSTETRKTEYVETDEVIKLTTKSLYTVSMTVTYPDADGNVVPCELLLTFDNSDKCTITSATEGVTVTDGMGEYKTKSEIKAWGNKDRDGLYLKYTIDLGSCKYAVDDILVARDRGSAASIREFKTVYQAQP